MLLFSRVFSFLFIFVFILGIKINAMDLLKEKEKGSKHFFEKWDFVSDQVMECVSDGNAKLISEKKLPF